MELLDTSINIQSVSHLMLMQIRFSIWPSHVTPASIIHPLDHLNEDSSGPDTRVGWHDLAGGGRLLATPLSPALAATFSASSSCFF